MPMQPGEKQSLFFVQQFVFWKTWERKRLIIHALQKFYQWRAIILVRERHNSCVIKQVIMPLSLLEKYTKFDSDVWYSFERKAIEKRFCSKESHYVKWIKTVTETISHFFSHCQQKSNHPSFSTLTKITQCWKERSVSVKMKIMIWSSLVFTLSLVGVTATDVLVTEVNIDSCSTKLDKRSCFAGDTCEWKRRQCVDKCRRVMCPRVLCREGDMIVKDASGCCDICIPCEGKKCYVRCAEPLCDKGEMAFTPTGSCCARCVTPVHCLVACEDPVCGYGEVLVKDPRDCCAKCMSKCLL